MPFLLFTAVNIAKCIARFYQCSGETVQVLVLKIDD